MQEVITLAVFVPFAVFYLNEPLKLDYLWAALCMVGAVQGLSPHGRPLRVASCPPGGAAPCLGRSGAKANKL